MLIKGLLGLRPEENLPPMLNPLLETLPGKHARRRSQAQELVQEGFWESLEQVLLQLGFYRKPRKWCREHFDWLVKRQVLGLKYSEIVPNPGTDAEIPTVREAVQKTAELVVGPGWEAWFRRWGPGRPRK